MNVLVPIGDVAAYFDLPISTLHYWERRGLITTQRRSGRRCYDLEQRHRIALIRLWRDTGLLSLDDIATVFAGCATTHHWRETVTGRISAIEDRISQLGIARDYLTHILDCPSDNPATDCPELRAQVAGPS